MKVYVSQAYLDWIESRRSDKKAIKAFERFFETVHNAKSVAEAPKPRNRENCTTKSGIDGTVIAYEVARTYRLYANWVAPVNGADVAFYAAVAMSKSNAKSQGDDIGKAITMFNSFGNVDWQLWEPSSDTVKSLGESKSDEEVSVPDAPIAEEKPKKQKRKPVDENGLTAAERKALRKKEQEEKQKQQRLAAEQKRRAAAATAKQEQPQQESEAKNIATDKTEPAPAPVIVVADVAPVPTPAPAVKNEAAVVPSREQEKIVPEPIVTVNDVPVVAPQQPTGDVKFQDVTNVQYELELIEHKMKIERLQIAIIQYNIAKAQREIALEELAIKKLKLLQAQKAQEMQK